MSKSAISPYYSYVPAKKLKFFVMTSYTCSPVGMTANWRWSGEQLVLTRAWAALETRLSPPTRITQNAFISLLFIKYYNIIISASIYWTNKANRLKWLYKHIKFPNYQQTSLCTTHSHSSYKLSSKLNYNGCLPVSWYGVHQWEKCLYGVPIRGAKEGGWLPLSLQALNDRLTSRESVFHKPHPPSLHLPVTIRNARLLIENQFPKIDAQSSEIYVSSTITNFPLYLHVCINQVASSPGPSKFFDVIFETFRISVIHIQYNIAIPIWESPFCLCV